MKEGAPIALVSIGAALVISTGGVDLSCMGVATLTGVLFAIGIQREWPPLIAIGVPITMGGVIGFLLGRIVAKDVPPLITSWSVGSLCTILSLLIAKNASHLGLRGTTSQLSFTVEGTWMDQWDQHGHGPVVWLLVLLGVQLLLAITNLPKRCCAIGANRISALYAGVRLGRSIRLAYMCSGALAAVAGMFFAIVNSSATTTDLVGKELQMIAVAVIGGTVLTGGYFNSLSVIASALFWTLIWSRSQTFDITRLAGSNQQHVANAMFATVILGLALTLGRRLSGFTAPVITEPTAKEIEP
jgi:ribose/xylose/arabinose/galactoside ABC-type transport system permease subunit